MNSNSNLFGIQEKQNIEWKESWRDEYLTWICGFANAQGGKIYIGKNYNVDYSGIIVEFRKFNEKYLKSLKLNDLYIKIILFVQENGKVTNTDVQKICEVSKRTASRYLADLEQKYIEKEEKPEKGHFMY